MGGSVESSVILTISKGKYPRSSSLMFFMFSISFGVMTYGVYMGLTFKGLAVAIIAGAGLVFIAAVGLRYLQKLQLGSSEVKVFHDGIEVFDNTQKASLLTLNKSFIPRDDISDIKIGPSLDVAGDPAMIRPGIEDMAISTRTGKDFFLIKRPSNQLRNAANILGFSESETSLLKVAPSLIEPSNYLNNDEDVNRNKKEDTKLVLKFTLFGALLTILMIATTGRITWIMFLPLVLFPGIMLFGVISKRRDPKTKDRTPAEVSVGREGITVILKKGTFRHVKYPQIKRVVLHFTTEPGKKETIRRGYLVVDGTVYSISPEIALAIREGYHGFFGHYPFNTSI